MARLFAQYLAIFNNKNCPSAKTFCQSRFEILPKILNKPSTNSQKTFEFLPKWLMFSPNLVTLIWGSWQLVVSSSRSGPIECNRRCAANLTTDFMIIYDSRRFNLNTTQTAHFWYLKDAISLSLSVKQAPISYGTNSSLSLLNTKVPINILSIRVLINFLSLSPQRCRHLSCIYSAFSSRKVDVQNCSRLCLLYHPHHLHK